MTESEVLSLTKDKMQKSVDSLIKNLAQVHTGRVHGGTLDHILVDFHGSILPIRQIANLNIVDFHTLRIHPYEKQTIRAIEKAIIQSNLGVNLKCTGIEVIVVFPLLTEERRCDLVKIVKSKSEHTKISIRNLRREANDHLKKLVKENKLSDDQEHRFQNDMQKLTNRFIFDVEEIIARKESEIMSI